MEEEEGGVIDECKEGVGLGVVRATEGEGGKGEGGAKGRGKGTCNVEVGVERPLS